MAQPFDATKLETTGEAIPVAERVPTFTSPSRLAGFTVSATGLLAYTTGAAGGQSRLVWKDRQGKVLGNLGEPTATITHVELSPDQKSAAVATQAAGVDIWVYDLVRGIPTKFTFDPKGDSQPVWSPDGRWIYFRSDRKGSPNIFRKASNGSGSDELMFEDPRAALPNGVSPDGKFLLLTRSGEKTSNDLWYLPVGQSPDGGKVEPKVFLQTPFGESNGRFSPDGQWVAYQSIESGQPQVYAAPFPGAVGKRLISTSGGTLARWSKNGKEIFYVSPEGQLMAAEVSVRNGTLEVGQVRKLLDGIVSRGIPYDVSADGQKFLVVDDGTAVAAPPLTLVQNWPGAMRK